MEKGISLRGRKRPWRHRMSRCLVLLSLLFASARAQAQQGPIVPGYDKFGLMEPMLGDVADPCNGPRLIAASDPFSFLYKQTDGSTTRAELRLRGALGLCMRHLFVDAYIQHSDVTRGGSGKDGLITGYAPTSDNPEGKGPWPESQDTYAALQGGPRFPLPSKKEGIFHHELLIPVRALIWRERDFKEGCQNGQCPWMVSIGPMYRLGLGIFRLTVGASVDETQLVTDWFEKNWSHPEHGYGSRRTSFSGLTRAGFRFGDEKDIAVLDLFAQAAITAPFSGGEPGRAFGAGAELAFPLIRSEKSGGASVTLKGRVDWLQQFVPEADCDRPERAKAACFYRGVTVGPILAVGFNFPGYALDPEERADEQAKKEEEKAERKSAPAPEPLVASSPQTPSPSHIPDVPTIAPAPVAPPPPPEPPPAPVEPPAPKKICKGILDRADNVVRTIVSETSGCAESVTLRRQPMDDVTIGLSVLVCRSNRGGVQSIVDTKTNLELTCEEILRRSARSQR